METAVIGNSKRSISPHAMYPPVPKRILRKRKVNFYDAIRPAFIVSRIFGLLPYTIHFDSNGDIERATVGAFNAIYFACSIAVILLFSYSLQAAFYSKIPFSQDSAILYIADRLFGIYGFVMWLLFVVLDMLNRNRLTKIFKKVIAFDDNVRKFG